MRILKIVRGDDTGGVFTCEKQFIKIWQNEGVSVDAIVVGEGDAIQWYEKNLSDIFKVSDFKLNYSGNIKSIFRNIKDGIGYGSQTSNSVSLNNSYDSIIYRHEILIHLAGFFGRKCNCPVFWYMPNSINSTLGRIYYRLFIKFYGIETVANSHYTKKSIGSICRHVVYPGFNEERIAKGENNFREQLNIPANALIFGNASRIHESKAQDILLEAFHDSGIMEKNNIHCIIAGGPLDTEYAGKLIQMAKRYPSKVHIIGYIENLSIFYNTIDIYVNSRRNPEPFGISIVEALASGIPVIAFKKGGPSETIKDGVTGWLVDKPSVESFKEGLNRAIKGYPVMKKNSNIISKSILQFEAKRNALKFISIISDYNGK